MNRRPLTPNERKVLNALATTVATMEEIAKIADLPTYKTAFALARLNARSLVVKITIGSKTSWMHGLGFVAIANAAAEKFPAVKP